MMKKKMINTQKITVDTNDKRRKFLKKAAWSVPGLIVLGQLVKPVDINADYNVDGPPDDGWTP